MPLTPERFLWAAGLMNIQPDDHILEIGCGAGLLAGQIAIQLANGKLVAIDRSEAMLLKAQQRNREHVNSSRLKFLKGDFAELSLHEDAFDKVVAFNVSFFGKDPARALSLIRKVLKRGGCLYVFYQYPYDITLEAALPLRRKLEEHNFSILEVQLKQLRPTAAFCIKARPAS
jgi:ubiquinone/menaquinone biosynthesis C-methylase UbiE